MNTGGDRPEATTRHDVLAALRDSTSPMSIVEIADRLGVHPNTARFHLESLTRRGQVEKVTTEPRRPGRPPLMFSARRGMDVEGPRNYQLLAGVLAGSIATDHRARDRAIASGRALGRQLARTKSDATSASTTRSSATDQLVEIMTDLGFAPQPRVRAGATQIALRHCPFLELVQDRSEVICPVHLGLMQGASQQLGGELRVASLEPFVEPDLCLAHLSVRTGVDDA